MKRSDFWELVLELGWVLFCLALFIVGIITIYFAAFHLYIK